MTNCPHCRNTGYDASGYPCACGLEVPETDKWKDYVLGLFFVVLLVISVILTVIKFIGAQS